LAADGASRPRPHDAAAVDHLAHGGAIELDLAAREQMIGRELVEQGGAAAVVEVGEADGQDAVLELEVGAGGEHLAQAGRGQAGNGKEELLDAPLTYQLG